MSSLYYNDDFPGYRDYNKALSYALKAPSIPHTYNILGNLYLEGNAVKKDHKKALELFEKGNKKKKIIFQFLFYFFNFFYFKNYFYKEQV